MSPDVRIAHIALSFKLSSLSERNFLCRYPLSEEDMPEDSLISGRLNTKYDVVKQTVVNLDSPTTTVHKSFAIRQVELL
eukprot:1190036-Amorphochlora_amoeboformis.AAC.1